MVRTLHELEKTEDNLARLQGRLVQQQDDRDKFHKEVVLEHVKKEGQADEEDKTAAKERSPMQIMRRAATEHKLPDEQQTQMDDLLNKMEQHAQAISSILAQSRSRLPREEAEASPPKSQKTDGTGTKEAGKEENNQETTEKQKEEQEWTQKKDRIIQRAREAAKEAKQAPARSG